MRDFLGYIGISAEQYTDEVRPMNFDVTFQDEGNTAVLDIEGYIGRDVLRELLTGEKSKNTAENLKDEIRSFEAEKIIVNIHSPGGDLSEGLVIKNMLQAKRAEVVTNLQGFSASAATVIHQAGDKRRMAKTSFELIHRAMMGVCGFINQNTTASMTENLQTIDNKLIELYVSHSNATAEEISALMDKGEGYGKWIDADQALEMGLVDEVYDPADEEDDDIDRLENKKKAASAVAHINVDGESILEALKNNKKESATAEEARSVNEVNNTVNKLLSEV